MYYQGCCVCFAFFVIFIDFVHYLFKCDFFYLTRHCFCHLQNYWSHHKKVWHGLINKRCLLMSLHFSVRNKSYIVKMILCFTFWPQRGVPHLLPEVKPKLFVHGRKERGLYISDTSRAVAKGYQGYPRELPRGCEEATVRLCDRLQIGEGGTVRVEESVMQTGPKHTLYLAVGWKSKKRGHEKPSLLLAGLNNLVFVMKDRPLLSSHLCS